MWRELVLRGDNNHGNRFNSKEKAEEYESRRKKRKGDILLERVKENLSSFDTVLDIGAGTGRWAIPLAKVTSKVTVIEPARAMSDILKLNAQKAGVSRKIELVDSTWEAAETDVCDMVICIHAMYSSPDFTAFVKKMEAHARRSCYMRVRYFPIDGIIQELNQKIHGTIHDSPDFIIAYNALLQMGIYADVFMEEMRRDWRNDSSEAAFARAKHHLHLENDKAHDELITATLKRRLSFNDGLYCWPDGMTTALISWSVS